MKVFSHFDEIRETFPRPVLTMGNFDGVHFGHQAIFQMVKERAQAIQGTSVVFTFDPHPQKILFPDREFFLINHVEEKTAIIKQAGVDVLIRMEFTSEFASQPARQFVKNVLVGQLHIAEMYTGYDSHFGQGKQGSPEMLHRWGKEYGFRVTIVPPIQRDGIIASSTRIRQLLNQGQVEDAALLLNRRYALDGTVVEGLQRGHSLLHCPTANIDVVHELIPKRGVYVCRVHRKGTIHPAVVNIGMNPTFENQHMTIEAHLLDFHETLYGEWLKVEFLTRIRDEIAYPNPQALATQIQHDIQVARAYFRAYESELE